MQTKCASWSSDLGWGRGGARQSGEGGDDAEVRDTMEIVSNFFVCTKEWWKKRSWAEQSLRVIPMVDIRRRVPIVLLKRQQSFLETPNLKSFGAI